VSKQIAAYDDSELIEIRKRIVSSRDSRHDAVRKALSGDGKICTAILGGSEEFRAGFDGHLLDRFAQLVNDA